MFKADTLTSIGFLTFKIGNLYAFVLKAIVFGCDDIHHIGERSDYQKVRRARRCGGNR
jgi:hypothetical protein